MMHFLRLYCILAVACTKAIRWRANIICKTRFIWLVDLESYNSQHFILVLSLQFSSHTFSKLCLFLLYTKPNPRIAHTPCKTPQLSLSKWSTAFKISQHLCHNINSCSILQKSVLWNWPRISVWFSSVFRNDLTSKDLACKQLKIKLLLKYKNSQLSSSLCFRWIQSLSNQSQINQTYSSAQKGHGCWRTNSVFCSCISPAALLRCFYRNSSHFCFLTAQCKWYMIQPLLWLTSLC